IAKPGKDSTQANSYRPISLTSCLCKTFERMINSRLVWTLESQNLLSPLQCGFRKRRSTVDHLIRLDSYVKKAFSRSEHAVTIFFDLEKAYDTTWKYGILKDLHKLGFRGRLPLFILNFLQDRTFQVRMGSTLSDTFQQEMGVPQGSVLSVTLFSIKINSIVETLSSNITGSLFVDDFSASCRSRNMPSIEKELQSCLDRLSTWAKTNGFKFSSSKTVCLHFCRKRGLHPDPTLFLDGCQIPVMPQYKFLGVIFDSKLNYIAHTKYLYKKCIPLLNLLRVLANTSWGSDRDTLLHVYRAIIRSKLDYGIQVYGNARKTYLRRLRTVQHSALRICLGAFPTSPVESLYTAANDPPLIHRQLHLSLKYMLRLRACPSNPAHPVVFSTEDENYYIQHNSIPPFHISYYPHYEAAGLPLKVVPNSLSPFPPWLLNHPHIDFHFHSYSKNHTSPFIFKILFLEYCTHFPHFDHIYTDGSKKEDIVAAASFHQFHSTTSRLPDGSSIYTAELKALLLALESIPSLTSTHFLIFSDSLSALQALSNSSYHPLLIRLQHLYHTLSLTYSIRFVWIPSHVGIPGNEIVDALAKNALSDPPSSDSSIASDYKPLAVIHSKFFWQYEWSACQANKLFSIQSTLQRPISYNLSRKDAVVYTRLRIGHTRLTHSFLLNQLPSPMCPICKTQLSIRHILSDCPKYHSERQLFFKTNDFQIIFTFPPSQILNYLHSIQLYSEI
ncbi:reverse transcriptase domain-containing protein, partial [Solemya velum gill symbiont]|uniref:reverse transcriptase domain-containing protein n=1 Tax=Solemya velum gill symbiont TaxID=2340 RepID=UPI00117B6E36